MSRSAATRRKTETRRPAISAPALLGAAALAAAAGLVLLPPSGRSLAQEEGASASYVPRDDEVEAHLRRARDLSAQKRWPEAVKAYLLAEDRLEARRREDPTARPVVAREGARDLFVGVDAYIREQLGKLPREALDAYRAARDPRADELFERALADSTDPAPLEEIALRYPLASKAAEALERLADLRVERGELDDARRALRERARMLARREGEEGAPERDALARKLAGVERLLAAAERAREAAWPMEGGAPDRAARAPAAPLPGAARYTVPLPSPEVSPAVVEGYARRGEPAPLVYRPVAAEGLLVIADSKKVTAIGEDDGKVRWIYGANDPKDPRPDPAPEPERLDNMAFSVAVDQGRVFATLNRNTAPIYESVTVTHPGTPGDAGGPGREPTTSVEDRTHRAADWRIVSLEARSGRLLWDAAASGDKALEAISRDARYVTPPLVSGGRVYLGATLGSGSLQTFAIALRASTGEVLWRTFVGSATPDDFRAVGCESAPLLAAGGLVCFETNLGTVVALDPRDGSIRWEARYRGTPVASQKRIVRDGLRFRLAAPRALDDAVVIAPEDAGYAIAYDLASGAERWRFERDGLAYVLGVSRGRLVFAGKDRVLALDPRTGRVAWEAKAPGLEPRGAGFATEERVYVPTAAGLALFRAEDGEAEGAFAFAPRIEPGGDLLVTPRGVYVFGASGVTAYDDRTPSFQDAKRRAEERPDDPRALMALAATSAAALGASPERSPAAVDAPIALFERAAALADRPESRAPDLVAAAREGAFALASRAADGAWAAGDHDLYFRFAARAAASAASGPDGAKCLRALAERLEAEGRAAEAAGAYYDLLWHDRDVPISLGVGIEAAAGEWARLRLVELRRSAGAAAFAAIDEQSSKAYDVATKAGTPEALQRVIQDFPATPREADALLALALFYERRDLANLAARFYALHAERYPQAPQAGLVAYKLARLYDQTKRRDEARRVLERLRDQFANERVDVGGEKVDLGHFARAQLDAYAARDERPSLPIGAADELRPSFETWTDLEDEEPQILVPRGLDRDRAPVFLVVGQEALEGREVETGARLWRHKVGAGFQRTRTGVAGRTLVVSTFRRVEALDFARGEPTWAWEARELEAAEPGAAPPAAQPSAPTATAEGAEPPSEAEDPLREVPDPDGPPPARPTPDGGPPPIVRGPRPGAVITLDPDPLKGVLVTKDRVIVALRQDLVCLDAASGKIVWRAARKETFEGDPAEVPGGAKGRVVAFGEPARMIALDIETGAEVYSLALGEHDPRITVRPMVAESGRIFCVVGGSELFAVDGVAGAVIWHKKLAYWPREIAASRDGAGLCVIPYGGADQPRLAVFDGASGAPLLEDKREKSRVGQVAFDGDRLYVFSGDFVAARLRAIDWRSGEEKWVWVPTRGQAFGDMTVARDHVILPQTGPTGEPIVYALDRERGVIYKAFKLDGRRVVTATVQRGSVLVSTSRGLFGYARLDPQKLREEQAEIAVAAAAHPEDASLRVLLADRRSKQGDWEGAAETLEAGLAREALTVDDYELLFRQLLGALEASPEEVRIEVGRLSHPPEIDGDLRDWWPECQSVRLAGPRHITPIQGYDRLGIWRGDDDLAGTLYLGWDQKNFYFALDVEDSALVPYDSESQTWKGDCLLIALDTLGNGGAFFQPDDNLLSLALTLPKKKKQPDEEAKEEEPEGKFFVKRKDDGSGAIYEAAIPWRSFVDKGAQIDLATGPKEGRFVFGLNIVVTDDDDNRGARKALCWTQSLTLHREKAKLWHGFVPRRFAKIILK
jgi:outer membrane protein assembly factor BamB/TolA-binding protein